jgi:hypothetical protein
LSICIPIQHRVIDRHEKHLSTKRSLCLIHAIRALEAWVNAGSSAMTGTSMHLQLNATLHQKRCHISTRLLCRNRRTGNGAIGTAKGGPDTTHMLISSGTKLLYQLYFSTPRVFVLLRIRYGRMNPTSTSRVGCSEQARRRAGIVLREAPQT